MIVDSHAYCFQPGDHPAGFPTPADHLAWIQTSQGLHHQPAWRVGDRTPASSAGLGDEAPAFLWGYEQQHFWQHHVAEYYLNYLFSVPLLII